MPSKFFLCVIRFLYYEKLANRDALQFLCTSISFLFQTTDKNIVCPVSGRPKTGKTVTLSDTLIGTSSSAVLIHFTCSSKDSYCKFVATVW